jgi:hypothetical protein
MGRYIRVESGVKLYVEDINPEAVRRFCFYMVGR